MQPSQVLRSSTARKSTFGRAAAVVDAVCGRQACDAIADTDSPRKRRRSSLDRVTACRLLSFRCNPGPVGVITDWTGCDWSPAHWFPALAGATENLDAVSPAGSAGNLSWTIGRSILGRGGTAAVFSAESCSRRRDLLILPEVACIPAVTHQLHPDRDPGEFGRWPEDVASADFTPALRNQGDL